ncbi:hypothetical protein ABT121_22400 [Streptomyces sp. NPDC001928]
MSRGRGSAVLPLFSGLTEAARLFLALPMFAVAANASVSGGDRG